MLQVAHGILGRWLISGIAAFASLAALVGLASSDVRADISPDSGGGFVSVGASAVVSETIGLAHVPVPSTTISTPTAGSVFTRPVPLQVKGTADADCVQANNGTIGYVDQVDVQFGDGSPWTTVFKHSGSVYSGSCVVNWQTTYTPSATADNVSLTIRARTTAKHGLPPSNIDTFTQSPSTEVVVRVDTLQRPPFVTNVFLKYPA